jgi:hypothetical protein
MGILVELMEAWFEIEKMSHIVSNVPPCALNHEMLSMWIGTAQEWFNIEIAVNIFFTFTMLLMLIKSRFTTIGIN